MRELIVHAWMTLDGVSQAPGAPEEDTSGGFAHGLVDRLQVMLDPLLVGGGKRIFPDDGGRRPLRLLDSQVTTTGAMLATYAAAET